MRILHLATSLHGGAGIAARRIAESQVNQGIDSEIWSNNAGIRPNAKFEKILATDNLSKLKSKLITYFQYKIVQNSDYLMTPISTQTLNLNDPRIESFDLINLHASYNFINLQALEEKFRDKPIVVTMHDERIFTGGCHYSLGCSKFESSCVKCPQVRKAFNWVPEIALRNQIEGISKSSNLKFVSPSNWLAKLARSSAMLNEKEISVIRNPVPSNFSHLPPSISRNLDCLNIAFVSENLHNPYKGFNILIEALRIIPRNKKVSLKLIGNGAIRLDLPNVNIEKKYCSSPNGVVSEIQKCDVLVVPSIQDNSPSVISESLMCGVPVIGAAVGGITEVLDEFGMQTFEVGNSLALAELICNFVPGNNINLANNAKETFSYPIIAMQYRKLYESLIST